MTEDKRDVRKQAQDAAEEIKYSGEQEGTPDFEKLSPERENFMTGREPGTETFKNEDEAYKHLQTKQSERREGDKAEADTEKSSVDTELRQRVGQARQATTAETQLVKREQDRLTADIQAFERSFNAVNQNWSKLDDLQRHQLQELAQKKGAELTARRDEFSKLARTVHSNSQLRQRDAGLAELTKYEPGLATPEGRKELVDWAVEKGLGTRAECEAVTDVSTIRRAHKQMLAEKKTAREAHLNRPRKTTYTSGPLAKGGAMPAEMTVEQAKARMQQTGSMQDAQNYMALSAQRRKEATK